MNIFVCGEVGSGKDTVAACLPYHERLSFGDEVRLVAKNMRDIGAVSTFLQASSMLDCDPPNDLLLVLKRFERIPRTKKDRELLQELGTHLKSIDCEVWIRAITTKMEPNVQYIITDVRYHDEFDALKKLGFIGVYVDSPRELRIERLKMRDGGHNVSSENHKAESQITSLREKCDYEVNNVGTVSDLKVQIDEIMRRCNMDRFSEGLPDQQDREILGYCDDCGDELYSQNEADDRLCNDCQNNDDYDDYEDDDYDYLDDEEDE